MEKLFMSIFSLICLTILGSSDGQDCETSWVAFKDQKCYKLIDQVLHQDEAEALCLTEMGGHSSSKSTGHAYADDDDDIPPLLTVKSVEEQEFLTKFIFQDSQVLDNVWLGAKRVMASNGSGSNEFLWPDGSSLDYTNWHEGSPSDIAGNDCTQMVPKGAILKFSQNDSYQKSTNGEKDDVDGRWTDVACLRRNLVVCQKLQTWSLRKLQKISLETTKALEALQNNPVPIGFVYVQLPDQPDAKSAWPNVQWEDVTADYAGLFFRAEGGQSAAFGSTQEDSTRQITKVEYTDYLTGLPPVTITLPSGGGVSEYVFSSYHHNPGTSERHNDGLRFTTSSVEVRPKNTAVRIWKRVA